MRRACFDFVRARLLGLSLDDGSFPFVDGNVFELEAGRDFFRENDFGAVMQVPQDRKRRDGTVLERRKDVAAEGWVITTRTHTREMLFRVALQAKSSWQLWGSDVFTGLVDQLEAAVAGFRGFADGSGCWVRCELVDAVRPWGESAGLEKRGRGVHKPRKAVVRVRFYGGIQKVETVDWIPDVVVTPAYK